MFAKIKKSLLGPFVEIRIRRLAHQLQSKDAITRLDAIIALMELNNPQTVDLLLAAHADEKDPYNRMLIASSLAGLGNLATLESLFTDIVTIDAEGKVDWDSAPGIAWAVAQLGESALPILDKMLVHQNATVRWVTVMALGEMKSERAIELLKQVQHDSDELVREEVASYLKEWSGDQVTD